MRKELPDSFKEFIMSHKLTMDDLWLDGSSYVLGDIPVAEHYEDSVLEFLSAWTRLLMVLEDEDS